MRIELGGLENVHVYSWPQCESALKLNVLINLYEANYRRVAPVNKLQK